MQPGPLNPVSPAPHRPTDPGLSSGGILGGGAAAPASPAFESVAPSPPGDALLDAGTPTVAVPVLVTAGRCDAHGLGGSTKPFDFSVQLALGRAAPTSLLFTPDDATRRPLFDGLEYLCRGRFEDR
ncbi:MAG: hypothetical protein M3P96_13045 [Actinomycetota bacterium]|nr:hypothetical protein [Actinomycetota bacterium]